MEWIIANSAAIPAEFPKTLLLPRLSTKVGIEKAIAGLFAAVYYGAQHNHGAKKIPHGNRFEGCLVCRAVPLKDSGKVMCV